jgi:hypothetical protein
MSSPEHHHCIEVIEMHKIFLLITKREYNLPLSPLFQHDSMSLLYLSITKFLLLKLSVRRESVVNKETHLTGF